MYASAYCVWPQAQEAKEGHHHHPLLTHEPLLLLMQKQCPFVSCQELAGFGLQ
jgi:hypothetical protein